MIANGKFYKIVSEWSFLGEISIEFLSVMHWKWIDHCWSLKRNDIAGKEEEEEEEEEENLTMTMTMMKNKIKKTTKRKNNVVEQEN